MGLDPFPPFFFPCLIMNLLFQGMAPAFLGIALGARGASFWVHSTPMTIFDGSVFFFRCGLFFFRGNIFS